MNQFFDKPVVIRLLPPPTPKLPRTSGIVGFFGVAFTAAALQYAMEHHSEMKSLRQPKVKTRK